jgi:O-antigen/teichoic acid export membrane protein
LLNYRLGYYIIERFLGKSSLGVFSTGTQVSEGLWLVGKSVATVQYAKISNSDDPGFARQITVQFVKIVFVITMAMLLVLLAIPDSFFVLVFKKDFTGLNMVILSLAGGILFMAISTIFSHYFSGTGRHHHNTIASGIGVLLTLIFGFTLIPVYGIIGAGITATISYFSSLVYQIIVFKRLTRTTLQVFLISRADYNLMKILVKEMLKR